MSTKYGVSFESSKFDLCSILLTALVYLWCISAFIMGHSSTQLYIDGLVPDYSNSSALAMELLQSCTNPSIW